MSRWIYPGSFDPVTLGHLDIIRRAAVQCETLTVVVMDNPEKRTAFTVEERLDMLRRVTQDLRNVSVCAHRGLQVNYIRDHGIDAAVRGIRSVVDWVQELELHGSNRILYPTMETIFLSARPDHAALSATAARQVASLGGDLTGFVPAVLIDKVLEKLYHS